MAAHTEVAPLAVAHGDRSSRTQENVVEGSFRLAVEADGLAILTFDCPGEKVNKYSRAVMEELDALLDQLPSRPGIKALLLVSGKPDIFIAGPSGVSR